MWSLGVILFMIVTGIFFDRDLNSNRYPAYPGASLALLTPSWHVLTGVWTHSLHAYWYFAIQHCARFGAFPVLRVFSGNLPFYDLNDAVVVTKIMDVEYDVPDEVSDGCKDLLAKLLVKEPEGRFTAQQARHFPALNFHHFGRIELDLRGHTHVRGAALSCLRLKLADSVLIWTVFPAVFRSSGARTSVAAAQPRRVRGMPEPGHEAQAGAEHAAEVRHFPAQFPPF